MPAPNKAGNGRRVTLWAIPFQGHVNSARSARPADNRRGTPWLVLRASIYRPTSAS